MNAHNTQKGRGAQSRRQSHASLNAQKQPRDDAEHLAFSITRHATCDVDYKKRTHESCFVNKKSIHKKTDAAQKKKPEVSVSVSRDARQRSPYVVRLGVSAAQHPHRKTARAPKSAPEEDDPAAHWLKEVDRMRREATSKYKSTTRRVTVDFLGKKPVRLRAPKKSMALRDIPENIPQLAKRAAIAVVRWLFEFILSMPLGFLLVVQLCLKLIESGHTVMVGAVKNLNRGIAFVFEYSIIGAMSLLRAVFVIPLKIISIALLGTYRLLSVSGMLILSLGNAGYETTVNAARLFAHPPRHFYQKVFAAVCITLVVVLPIKLLSAAPSEVRALQGRVLGATEDGFRSLTSLDDAVGQGEVVAAGEQLRYAQSQFERAHDSIKSLNIVVQGIIKLSPKGQDGMHAIGAGEDMSRAGVMLTDALEPLGAQTVSELDSVALLSQMSASLSSALPYLTDARTHLEAINSTGLPEAYRAQFEKARQLLPRLEKAVADFADFSRVASALLGAGGTKRYAVLFQNNNELRPAGGFIGSLAFIDVLDGKITRIDIPGGGSYDFQGYLTEHVQSPKPLWLINPRWQLQDANWYPDWPTSAAKVAWFIEKSGYSSVDGVIALQATSLVKLLELLGPVSFPEHNVTLTSQNVLAEMQTAVELAYDKEENKPKEYIAELVPRIMEQILSASGSELVQVLSLLKQEIAEKQALFYFSDSKLNAAFARRGWQPSIIQNKLDYLSVIHANIGGGKTDGVIDESWDYAVDIDEDGNAVAELSMVRRHTGDPADLFERYNNVDYTRLYVPQGSELINFEGIKPPPADMFEQPESFYKPDDQLSAIEGKVVIDEATGTRVTQEFGKTAFGNWLQVDPGNVLFTKVKYKLPFKIRPHDLLNPDAQGGYSLVLQKQAGARAIPYSVSVKYPAEWGIGWQKSAGTGTMRELGPGLVSYDGYLSQDSGFGLLFTKKE